MEFRKFSSSVGGLDFLFFWLEQKPRLPTVFIYFLISKRFGDSRRVFWQVENLQVAIKPIKLSYRQNKIFGGPNDSQPLYMDCGK